MLCFRCGSQVAQGAAACQNCGQQISATQRSAMSPLGRPTAPTLPRVVQRTLQSPLPFKLNDVAVDRYVILRLIGEGPLGVVYVAHDRETEVDLALKVVRPAILARPDDRDAFLEVMALVRGVGHFNLNHVIDVNRDGERCFYTTPLLEGLSLRKLMALRRSRTERFGLAEVVPIAAQVADALQAGARIGAHGDLKPDNVVILPEMLKVTDFGLAAAIPRAAFVAAQRRTVESSAYLAPEVREGADPDLRSDLYSFGVLLAELLTGQIVTAAPVRLRDHAPALPEALDAVLDRLLDEDPAARPESAEEAVQDLAAAETGSVRSAMPVPVRRTFGPEQTQRISMDMLEEVLETSEGMDEEAFAKSIEEQAQAIDRQTADALATDGLTDPSGLSPVPTPSRRAPAVSADVTQKLSTDMVVEMLQGESLQAPVRPATRDADDLDPRLVRAALGMELEDAEPLRTDPAMPVHDFEDGTDETARGLPPIAREAEELGELAPGERTEEMIPFEESGTGEVQTALERPLPDRTGPTPQAPPPADLVFAAPRPAPAAVAAPGAPRPQPPAAPRPRPPAGGTLSSRPAAMRPTAIGVGPPASPPPSPPRPRPSAAPPLPSSALPAPRPRPPVRAAAPAGATLPGAAGPAVPSVPRPSPAPAPPPAAVAAPAPAPTPVQPPVHVQASALVAASSAPPPAAPAAAPLVLPGARPTSRPGAVTIREAEPGLAPSKPGVSDEWYAQGKEVSTGEIDVDLLDMADSGPRRREQTRIVPRYEEPARDPGSIWVWVALAIGASAFILGAAFYYKRYTTDRERERVQQQMQQDRQVQPPSPVQPQSQAQPQLQQQLQPQPQLQPVPMAPPAQPMPMQQSPAPIGSPTQGVVPAPPVPPPQVPAGGAAPPPPGGVPPPMAP